MNLDMTMKMLQEMETEVDDMTNDSDIDVGSSEAADSREVVCNEAKSTFRKVAARQSTRDDEQQNEARLK